MDVTIFCGDEKLEGISLGDGKSTQNGGKMAVIDQIKKRAKLDRKTIVLPEGMDRRTYEAAAITLREEIADLIIIATEEEVQKNSKGLDIEKATIINPFTYEKTQEYVDAFVELRKDKGMTQEEAYRLLTTDYMYYACMMVKLGEADGAVSGACHSTANTLRPSLQIIKAKKGTKLVSGFFLMDVPDSVYGERGVFVFSDCGLVQWPTAEELAAITESAAESFELLVERQAVVAMLSHSTKGSAKHPEIDKVAQAYEIVKRECPDLAVDGEMQSDAALVRKVGESKAPGSEVAGRANVLIFPNLDAGNIGYKLVERLAKAEAYGPLTQGMAKPINDLSRGCSSDDIVGVIAITAVQAQAQAKEERKLAE